MTDQINNLYLSGGNIYMEVYDENNNLGKKLNMGAVEITLSRETEKKEAFTYANGPKQKIAEVVTSESYRLKIKINKLDKHNLATALGSKVEEVVFKEGSLLPSGDVAPCEVLYTRISAGTNPLLRARITFVGEPVRAKRQIAVIHDANISMSGDITLLGEDFSTIEFEASANKTNEGYYTHYIEEFNINLDSIRRILIDYIDCMEDPAITLQQLCEIKEELKEEVRCLTDEECVYECLPDLKSKLSSKFCELKKSKKTFEEC